MRRKRLTGGWNPRVERRGIRVGPGITLGLLLGVAGLIGVAHNRLRAAGATDPVLGMAQGASLPAQTAAASVNRTTSSFLSGVFRGGALEGENARLREQLGTLKLENEHLRLQAQENSRLRTLLGIVERATPAPLVADVIAWLPSDFEKTITVALGSRAGVTEGMAVRNAEGLIGKVADVGPFTAKVRLLTDPDSGVGVRILGTSAFGILKGNDTRPGGLTSQGELEVIHLEKSMVIPVGAVVTTSGHGGIFPPDIPVGTVSSVRDDPTHLLRIAVVKPFAPLPGALRQVLILPQWQAPEPLPNPRVARNRRQP